MTSCKFACFKLDLKLLMVVDDFSDAERQFQTSAPL